MTRAQQETSISATVEACMGDLLHIAIHADLPSSTTVHISMGDIRDEIGEAFDLAVHRAISRKLVEATQAWATVETNPERMEDTQPSVVDRGGVETSG